MRTNLTKAKLNDGKVVFGALIGEYDPSMVEVFGLIGYDFVMLDAEHGSFSLDQLENMIRAAELFDITPIVRVVDQRDATILQALDRGAQGVIIPHVNTAAQAAAVVKAARYGPEGHRGAANGRAHDYGVGRSRTESSAVINENVLVIPMVEEVEAVANLDAITAAPGVDILHVASSDLGQSMGNPPQAEVRAEMAKIVPRIRAAGKHAGIGGNAVSDTAGIASLIDVGANFVTISALALIRSSAETFRDAVLSARKAASTAN